LPADIWETADHNYDNGLTVLRPTAAGLMIDQVIIGGESGRKRRDCGIDAITKSVQLSLNAGVRVFVKQDCALLPGQQGRIPKDIWDLKQFPGSYIHQ
jgi:hypothetical protein